jgi:hypothetical protein
MSSRTSLAASRSHTSLAENDTLVGSDDIDTSIRRLSNDNNQYSGYGTLRSSSTPCERIILRPPRVEPKVHLANERTLFHWLNLAVVLTTVAVGFLNSSLPGAAWLAVLFTAAASGMMIYSLRYYYWRMDRIAYRDTADYSKYI